MTLAASAPLYLNFDKTSSALQFVETREWIPSWGITYGMGVDGISVLFIFLASVLIVLCIGASWLAVRTREREFYAALLVAETAMIGLFAASNLFLFFIFWELIVVPLFLLIGIWGGEKRVYAAVKFLIFTLAGSVLMLVGMMALYNLTGTLDFKALALARESLESHHQAWLFAAFLAAFAVKVPMFPVHTWLPDAHTEAPTAGSVILAGILLKMGAYGFLRVSLPILPDGVQFFLEPMLAISAVAIVYGAYVTLVQKDIKRLIAFSSVSHMGFVTLGIFTLDQRGSRRRDPPDVKPRNRHLGALSVRRHDLRTHPHERDQRLWRDWQGRAGLRHVLGPLLSRCCGIPGSEFVRRGVPYCR